MNKLIMLNLDEARRAEWARRPEELPVKAALAPSLFALGAPSDEAGFRRIGGVNTLRELNPAMLRRMQDICYYLAVATPFGEGIVRVMVDYIVGEGFQFIAEHPDTQAYLDAWARDPVNDLAANIPRIWREWLIFGEQCLPIVENPVDGFVRLGNVDPSDIEAVEFGTLITPDRLKPISLPVSVKLVDLPSMQGARLRIAQSISALAQTRSYDGDCFYFAMNQAKSGSRGFSELFSLADWIDVFDQTVFDFLDKVHFLNSFVWDYTLKGADEPKVDAYVKYLRKNPPKQGGFQVHNDQVEMQTLTPDFKGSDMGEVVKMAKAYGPGSKSLPPWFFGDPMDANRAANEVMEGPSGKMLTNKQQMLKRAIKAMGDYALDRAIARGTLAAGIPRAWKVQAPDISVKDMGKVSTTLQTASNALATMEDRGWIRPETAARASHMVLGQMGVEVDSKKEFGEAQKEKRLREAQEIDALAKQDELAEKLKQTRPATEVTQ